MSQDEQRGIQVSVNLDGLFGNTTLSKIFYGLVKHLDLSMLFDMSVERGSGFDQLRRAWHVSCR